MTMKHTLFIPGVLLLLAAGGCGEAVGGGGYPPGAPERVQAVDEIMLMTSPLVVSFDGALQPNGFTAGVWFFDNSRGAMTPPTLVRGGVEILMYDGIVPAGALRSARPLHVWEFPGDQLSQHVGKHIRNGWGYSFQLRWGGDVPTQDRITVVARYLGGPRPVESAPSSVIVREK